MLKLVLISLNTVDHVTDQQAALTPDIQVVKTKGIDIK
mgnify:CR=1 FL=1